MQVTLAKVHHLASLSEETNCFDAVVELDGVPAFHASNRGHGGMTDFNPLPKQSPDAFRAQVARLEEFAKTLPVDKAHGIEIQPDAEILVDRALTDWLLRKDYLRTARTKIVLTVGTEVRTLKGPKKPADLTEAERTQVFEFLAKKHPGCEVLNYLPENVAVAKYIATARSAP